MSVSAVASTITAVSAISQMGGSDEAVAQQGQGAAASDATQRYMYDTTRKDNAPFLKSGTAANHRLSYLLGVGPKFTAADAENKPEYQNIRAQLLAAADAEHQAAYGIPLMASPDAGNLAKKIEQIKEQALDTYNQQYGSTDNDPTYGSLLKNFSAADLNADPIYQSTFQNALDNGNRGINQQASATGSLLSGNTLKALSRFGANTAASYGNDAYNRYNTNNANTYNRLAGLSGAGQTAVAQVGGAGQNAANNISASQIGLGNARGASAIAKSNALSGGLNSIGNMFQQNFSNNLSSPYSGTGYSNSDISGLQDYQGLY